MVKSIKFIALAAFFALILSSDFQAKAQNSVNGIADTPWPMYQHDPQHTGRSPFLGPTHQPILLWSVQIPDCGGDNGGISIASDGNLLISEGGCLFNFDPVNRQIEWEFWGSHSRGVALVATDGSLYWGNGPIFSQISPSGEAVWQAWLDDNNVFGSSATFGLDGNLFFVHDGTWSFTPDGEYRWYIPYGSYGSHASPAIGLDGTVYAGGQNVDICAYLPDGSGISWCAEIDGSGGDKTSAVASNGTIYYPASDGYVVALNPVSIGVEWVFNPDEESTQGIGVHDGIAIAADGSIRFGLNPDSTHTYLYAIDAEGEYRWKVPFSANPLTEGYPSILFPIIVDRAGNAFVCPANATCYGIGPDGTLLWENEFPMLDSIDLEAGIQPVIAADGLFYILDTQQHLYAFADPALYPALASSTGSLGFEVEPGTASFSTTLPVSSTIAPITYTATITPEVAWLALAEPVGVTPSEFNLLFNPQAVPAGVYRTSVKIMPSSQSGMWLEIPVTLNVGMQQAFLPAMVKGYNTANRILYMSDWFTERQFATIKQTGKDRAAVPIDLDEQIDYIIYAPDGNKVALMPLIDGKHQIDVLDTSTGAIILEIVDFHELRFPTWSPDSTRLAYLDRGAEDGNGFVYTINLDGSGKTLLTPDPLRVTNLFWSPRGDKIVVDIGTSHVYLMNSDGTDLHEIITNNVEDTTEGWSPDGRYLLLCSRPASDKPYQLGTYDLETGSYTYLTDHFVFQADWVQNAVWSPDGTKIAYRGYEDASDYDIFVINADGSGMTNLTYALDHEDALPVWSPNSRWIAFASRDDEINNDPNYDIFIIRADGFYLTQLTTNILADNHPFWMP